MSGFTLKNTKGALLGFALMLVIFLVVVVIGQAILLGVGLTPESNTFVAISGCFSILAIALTLTIFCKSSSENLGSFLKEKKTKPIYYALALILAGGMFLGLGFLNTVIVNLLEKIGVSTSSLELNINDFTSLIVFLVVYAILPAIFEELFFRKYMLSQAKELGNFASVVLVSLAFAVYHLSLAQLVYQLIYGVFLAMLTNRSRSIIPATLSHFINNASIIVMQYLSIQIDLFSPILIVIGLCLLALFVVGTIKVKND